MVARQVNENRVDIDPQLGQALASHDFKLNLDSEMRENYDVVRAYLGAFPDPTDPPSPAKVESVLRSLDLI